MARILKSTGIAADLVFLVAVDDDNTTIKEWVSSDVNTNMDTNSLGTGTDSWKSVTVPYFGAVSDTAYIEFPVSHRPIISDPFTLFFVFLDGPAAVSGTAGMLGGLSGVSYNPAVYDNGSVLVLRNGVGGSAVNASTTSITSTRDYSIVIPCREDSGTNEFYYGLESGSLASDRTFDNSGNLCGNSLSIGTIGRVQDVGFYAAKYVLAGGVNRVLSLAEAQSIHDDPVGTLFEASGGTADAGGMLLSSRRNRLTIP